MQPTTPDAILALFKSTQLDQVTDPAVRTLLFNRKLEAIEGRLLELGWKDLPATHHFADGVYFREGVIPKGSLILGHAHRHEELTVFFSGKLLLCVDGQTKLVVGPKVVKTAPGVRKVGYVVEDVRGGNIFPNPDNLTDVKLLEDRVFAKSETYKAWEAKQLHEAQAQA